MLRNNIHNNFFLQKDWSEYGEESFVFKVLKSFEYRSEAETHEMYLINTTPNVYNIVRDKSVGGDYFTHNPRKEKIRQQKSLQMSGKNNHQYGKPKTKKMLKAVKKANSKPVKIEGVNFASIAEASRILKINDTTISYRLKSDSERFKKWNYV